MRTAGAVLITLAVLHLPTPAQSAEAPTLQACAAAIDRALTQPDGDRIVVGYVSRKLTIPVATLRVQHAQTGLGWGDILIANHIAATAGAGFDPVVAEQRNGKA